MPLEKLRAVIDMVVFMLSIFYENDFFLFCFFMVLGIEPGSCSS